MSTNVDTDWAEWDADQQADDQPGPFTEEAFLDHLVSEAENRAEDRW